MSEKQFRLRLNPNKEAEWYRIKDIVKQIGEENAVKLLSGENVDLGVDFFLEKDKQVRGLKSQLSDVRSKYNLLLHEFEELDNRFNDFVYINDVVNPSPIKIGSGLRKEREATAISIWSDWHVEEVVKASQVQGLNTYNPGVAKTRSETLARNLLSLIEKERASIEIKNLVIHLGGDFIGNWIHPELAETNALSPVEATIFAGDLLISAIQFLIDNGNLERLVLLCNAGNHGRTTKKMQFANLVETSYETIIYDTIAKSFRNSDVVELEYPESGLGYFDVYGFKLRYYHGHQCRYGGGVGGITIPLNKLQAKWDKTIKAHYNLMGHYHNYSHPNSNTILNGSLKGYDAFAAEKGFEYERPTQAFALIDSEYGMTIRCPIFCD